MIWDRVDTSTFRVTYQTLLLSLEGAIARAADALTINPLRALQTGHREVAQLAQNRDGLQAAARNAVRSTAELGAAAAGGPLDEQLLALEQSQVSDIVQRVLARDVGHANDLVRRQAIRYHDARRTLPAPVAKLQATSELGPDVFSQLDRAGRRFDSLDLVDGYVRVAMARAYAQQFVAVAEAAGAKQAVLAKPGEPDHLVPLDQLDLADFHPNTTAELRLP